MNAKPRYVERLVLSVRPLSAGVRTELESGETEFADLAELSLGGIGRVRRFRSSVHAGEVVVAGTEAELAIFGDVLAVLARLVRARSRWIRSNTGKRRRLADRLPMLLTRMGWSTMRGFLALAVNSYNSRSLTGAPEGLELKDSPTRCLYLRPMVLFGEQVGGSVGHVAGVVNSLARRGHSVNVVAMSETPLLDARVLRDIIAPSVPAAFPNELNRHRFHREFLGEALHAAARFRPSYLYARYSLCDLTGPLLRRKLRVPLILEYNGSEVWAQRHWGNPLLFEATSRRIEEANLRSADLVVVVSKEIRRQVLSIGIPEEKILFYPNCVDPQLFDPLRFDAASRVQTRAALGLPQDSAIYTFVGTFGRWHGTDVLAQAIRRLLDTHRAWLEGQRIHFLFVGDGLLAPRVREILGPGTSRPFVTLAGYQPQSETAAILAASDVLLSPHVPNADGSPFFGSPTKLFEYMAMDKPIVASDLDQIGQVLRGWSPDQPDSVSSDSAAVLVKPGDVDDLVRGILLVGEMAPAQREELGHRARALVLRSFTWDQNVEAVLARLNRVLDRPDFVGKPPEAKKTSA